MPYEYDITTGQYVDRGLDFSGGFSSDFAQKNSKKKSDAISVTDALTVVKQGLESMKFKILGEVSQVSNKAGYKAVYFTVKDKKSALPCLIWKSMYDKSSVELEVGALVELTGKFSVYAAKGRMNFNVSSIKLAGEGDLRLQVAQLAKKLEKEGLTADVRKRAIPELPEAIGVVTSPRGAVIDDVLRTLRRRMPLIKVKVAGVPVEGAMAAKGMIEALDCAAKSGVEVVLLVRGGGSFEDLMPFNDEALARKIAECPVPVVTGIGHEPDTTIADLVSDRRASTPTAAAEAVSMNSTILLEETKNRFSNVGKGLLNRLDASNEHLKSISSRPIFADVSQLFSSENMHLDHIQDKLASGLSNLLTPAQEYVRQVSGRAVFSDSSQLNKSRYEQLDSLKEDIKRLMPQGIEARENEVALMAAKLHDKSPLVILSRGYSVTTDARGKLIKSIEDVAQKDIIEVRVKDGQIDCEVLDTKLEEHNDRVN